METRSDFVKTRVTPSEKSYIERVARDQGTDTAGLIRRLLFDAAPDRVAQPPSLLDELEEITPKPETMVSSTETFGAGWPD